MTSELNELAKAAKKIMKNIQTTKNINSGYKSVSPRSHFSTEPVDLGKDQLPITPKHLIVQKFDNIADSLTNQPPRISKQLAASKIHKAHKSRLAKNPQTQISR